MEKPHFWRFFPSRLNQRWCPQRPGLGAPRISRTGSRLIRESCSWNDIERNTWTWSLNCGLCGFNHLLYNLSKSWKQRLWKSRYSQDWVRFTKVQNRRIVFTECASEGPEMVHMAFDQFSRFPPLPELFFPSFWTRKVSRWTGCPTFALFLGWFS